MNKHELLYLFETKIGQLMTNTDKTFETGEVEVFLNDAQNIYFKELADYFEASESVRRSLSNFVKGMSISAGSTPSGVVPLESYSVFYILPSYLDGSLYRIVEEYVNVSGGSKVKVKPVTHDQYQANIKNPFKKPYSDLAWRVDVSGAVEIIAIGVTPTAYEIRYLEKPDEITFATSSGAELPWNDTDLHKIADISVQLALGSLSVVKPKE